MEGDKKKEKVGQALRKNVNRGDHHGKEAMRVNHEYVAAGGSVEVARGSAVALSLH